MLVVQDPIIHQLSQTVLPIHAAKLSDHSVCLPRLVSSFESVLHDPNLLSIRRQYNSGTFATTTEIYACFPNVLCI